MTLLSDLRSTVTIPKRGMPAMDGHVSILTNWAADTSGTLECNDHSSCQDGGDRSDFDVAIKNPDSDLYKVVQTVTATA
jgi:hypothetical protein